MDDVNLKDATLDRSGELDAPLSSNRQRLLSFVAPLFLAPFLVLAAAYLP